MTATPIAPWRRVGLGLALAYAGRFTLPGARTAGPDGGMVLVIAIAIAVAGAFVFAPRRGREHPRFEWPRAIAAAIVAAVLVREAATLVLAVPGLALASVLGLGVAAWAIAGRCDRPGWTAGFAVTLVLAGGLLGVGLAGVPAGAHGRAESGPILGVQPRQAVAVRLDGFGPHDLITDDIVDPADAPAWAATLEAQLHAIAQTRYVDGPARARAAYGGARVRARGSRIVVRSGTIGSGSSVWFECPGAVGDPRPAVRRARRGACPTKYAVDGSTGLGLSPRWPGYAEVDGRDRLRPRLGASDTVELGALMLLAAGIAVALAQLARGHAAAVHSRIDATGGVVAGVAGLLVLLAAALAGGHLRLESTAALSPGGLAASSRGLSTLVGLAILAWPAAAGEDRRPPIAAAIVTLSLAASPLAGGDALDLADAVALALPHADALDWGRHWHLARASFAALALCLVVPATLDLARVAIPRGSSEPRHASVLAVVAVLASVAALALRKPAADPALLFGAATWFIATHLGPRRSPIVAVALAIAATAPLWPVWNPAWSGLQPVEVVAVGTIATATLFAGWR